jgi:hypothetical protein
MIEKGWVDTSKIVIGTLFAIGCSYIVIDNEWLQTLVYVFPEVLLAVLAGYLLLGRWTGMRLFEIKRFRSLLVE